MGLMEKFADPALFDSLSFSEKMGGSAVTMLMGMGITFIILCILWGFVAFLGKLMDAAQKKNKASDPVKADASKANALSAAAADETAAGIAADTQAPQADDEVIAAVIAAAVCAYQESGGTGNLVVKKISRVSGGTNLWVNAAREDCMQSRKI